MSLINNSTICAIATAPGMGAIATIRISGSLSFQITDKVFRLKSGKKIDYRMCGGRHFFGEIIDQDNIIDEVVVTVFQSPHSFTGEDTVEISCHGSVYLQNTIMQLLIKNGAQTARPGEFTQRAFLNGKMDLSQAEAVADVISASSASAHKLALKQMRGGVSNEIMKLRNELLTFISLVELELDFGEEDVEFADRKQLTDLVINIEETIGKLTQSFQYGNAIKNGIPVTIVGNANVGKSTLLNLLLKEEKALVSDIAGTTRDAIEDVIFIEGIQFRFIDTAGIRTTTDTVENMGIERTFAKIAQAEIVIMMIDAQSSFNDIIQFLTMMSDKVHEKHSAMVINKIDQAAPEELEELKQLGEQMQMATLPISAKNHENIDQLVQFLVDSVKQQQSDAYDVVISNARHYEALVRAHESITRVKEGLETQISGDFLAQDIRECLHHLGEITGDISTDEVLGNIFRNFCIGK